MTLEFRPPQIPQQPSASDYAQQWSQGLNNIGDSFTDLATQRRQEAIQAMLFQMKKQESDRQNRESAYKYGTPINPNSMIAEPTSTIGRSSQMPGGQGPVGRGSPLIDAFEKWRAGGMKQSDARPEYMPALGLEERKIFLKEEDTDSQLAEADLALKKARAEYLSRPPQPKAPAAPSSELSKRSALVQGARQSIGTAKILLTPNVLNEMKSIKLSPGKIYTQLASSEAKKFYRNLYNAISNQLYIKSGATATPSEIEGNMMMYMAAYNDEMPDMMDRLNMLESEVSLFDSSGGERPPTPTPTPSPKDGRLMWEGRPLKDTPANRAWLAAQQGDQK